MTSRRVAGVAGCLLFVSTLISFAAPFEPLFMAKRVSGSSDVRKPDSESFDSISRGKAYPFGSAIRTGKRSQLTIELSPGGNEVDFGPNANAVVTEDKDSKQHKIIRLDVGKIQVEIEGAEQNGGTVSVETGCAAVESQGMKFSVESRREQDLAATIFMVDKGSLKAFGPNFTVPVLDGDDVLFVSCAYDQSFTRIRNVRGQFTVELVDSEGNPKNVEMEKDEVVKIWRKDTRDGNQTMLTILVSAPDGVTKDSIQRIENKPAPQPSEAPQPSPVENVSAAPVAIVVEEAVARAPDAGAGDAGKGEGAGAESDAAAEGGKGAGDEGQAPAGTGEDEKKGETPDEPSIRPFDAAFSFGASDIPIVTLPPPPGIPPEAPTPTEVGRR